MREIKFRAWDKVKKMMRTEIGHLHHFGESGVLSITLVDTAHRQESKDWHDETLVVRNPPKGTSECVLMQYTGLKDKNGKEIYEGDIVKDHNDLSIGKVSWNEDWMKWDIGAEGKQAEDKPYVRVYIEVIGNIYEDKDLLT
jgi:uncharacterized phage protein (TIGR01671 family)